MNFQVHYFKGGTRRDQGDGFLFKCRPTLFIVDPSTPYCGLAYMKTDSLQDKFTLDQAC